MKHLTNMVDFVLEQSEQLENDIHDAQNKKEYMSVMAKHQEKIFKYANFLKQKLELWMFIPCKLVDGEWIVLECPKNYKQWEAKRLNTPYDMDLSKYENYQQAKELCLFEGFEVKEDEKHKSVAYGILNVFWFTSKQPFQDREWRLSHGINTIEDLMPYTLTLTETAIKNLEL